MHSFAELETFYQQLISTKIFITGDFMIYTALQWKCVEKGVVLVVDMIEGERSHKYKMQVLST